MFGNPLHQRQNGTVSLETPTSTFGLGDFPPLHLPVRRLTVDEYHEMLRAGILKSGDPVELLEGILVTKMTKHPPHVLSCGLIHDVLNSSIPSGWFVQAQDPVTTTDSEPEPDAMVVRGKRRDYVDRHPGPEDVALVVEVSEVTLARDRGPKKRLYARASLPIYWIVNLVERQIEVYTDPTGPCDVPDYRQRQDYVENDEVPLIVEGKEVARLPARDMLP